MNNWQAIQLKDIYIFFQSETRMGFLFLLDKVKLLLIVPSAFKNFPLLSGREVLSMMFPFPDKIFLKCYDLEIWLLIMALSLWLSKNLFRVTRGDFH